MLLEMTHKRMLLVVVTHTRTHTRTHSHTLCLMVDWPEAAATCAGADQFIYNLRRKTCELFVRDYATS